jgi:hypothetical protein
MSAKKPLIFIAPLSDSLQKLKEVIEEVAEDEKIEIFEVEDASEVAQLIPTVGQSLSIFANPKKCAMVLQPNRKVIQKLNSKVILLSKKSMPRKTMDKFSKIGLTECIVEPVAPKTLLYKVRLLLRSIVVAKDEEDEEVDTSFGSSDSETEDETERQRLEKGIASDEEVLDYNMKGKTGQGLDLSADDEDDEEKGSNYSEEAIQKEWKGSVNETDLSMEEEEEKKRKELEESENYIDSYLRGKKNSNADDIVEEDYSSKKKKAYEEEEEEEFSKNQELSLDLEADEDEDSKDKLEHELESDDKYYKGKVAGEDLDFEEEEKKKREDLEEELEEDVKRDKDGLLDMELEDEDDDKKRREEDEEDEEDIYSRNKDVGLDLEADEDDENGNGHVDEDAEEDEDQNGNGLDTGLDLEAEDEDRERDTNNELELEEEREKKEYEKLEEEEQDSHMRGKVAQVIEMVEEEDIDARNRHELEADEDDDENGGDAESSLDLDAEDDDHENGNGNGLELEEGDENSDEDSNNGLELEHDVDDYHDDKKTDLELVDDENDLEDSSNDEDDEEDHSHDSAASLDLEFDDESEAAAKKAEEDEDGDYARRSTGADLELEEDLERKRHSAHTEHIDTRMDSRKGIDHQEQDWDILGKKDKTESHDEEGKKKSDIQISFKEAVDLGEQTIDYRKLQNEFDAITINRVGGKRKRTGPKYYSEDMTDEEYLKGVYGEDYEDALEDIAGNLKNRKDKASKTEVFHPTPQGLDEAVRVMNLYHNKSLKKEDIFGFIATSLLERFGGHTFFFSMNPETSEFTNSYSLLSNTEGVDTELLEKWPALKEEHYSEWLEMNLPKWHDEKMITEDNVFFYPIYEGANKLGFAVVMFNKLIEKDQAKSIEIILETVRGIVLDEFHKAGKTEKYDVDLRKKDEEEKKGGFFKSLFGRFSKNKAS